MTSNNLSRRSILIAAASAIPLRAAVSAPSPVMARLSSYMSRQSLGQLLPGGSPLPEEALEHTKRHILDTFAAMVSGSELAPGRFAINFARAHATEKTA